MTDLKGDLASLRLDREAPARRSWRWPLLLLLPVVLVLGVLYAARVRGALRAPGSRPAAPSSSRAVAAGEAAPPVLAASGYVVARRKAVVSAKIQGRLAELRVEEGSRVREGEVIARLESTDYEAQVRRAAAAVQRAEADLRGEERQRRVAAGLAGEKIVARDQLEPAESRVRLADAALAQAQAELGSRRPSSRTRSSAPRSPGPW